MNVFKNIVGRLYAFYALMVFVITLIPTYLILRLLKLVVSSSRFEIIFHKAMKAWMGVYLPSIFCPVKTIGAEKFEPHKNYVVVLNHNSHIDIPVSTPCIPGPNKTLGKSDFAKVPLFGFIYKSGSILLNRKEARSKQRSYDQMLQVLNNNLHVCLYPEGTRNKTAQPLQAFKDGAFKLAIESKKPLMVGLIEGTKPILTANKVFHAWPSNITITYLTVIATSDASFKDVKLLNQKAYTIMNEALLKRV